MCAVVHQGSYISDAATCRRGTNERCFLAFGSHWRRPSKRVLSHCCMHEVTSVVGETLLLMRDDARYTSSDQPSSCPRGTVTLTVRG